MKLRHLTAATSITGIVAVGLGAGLALSACGGSTSSATAVTATGTSAPAVTATPTTASTTTAGPATTVPTKAAPATAPSATTAAAPVTAARGTLVPMQTATGGEFLSPSGNISCEIDYHRAGLTQLYCQTATPARSVTMNVSGRYTTCAGQQCLGNPGDSTPTLAYGTATGVGPFRCASAATGVTCVADGRGFRISTSGITPASAA